LCCSNLNATRICGRRRLGHNRPTPTAQDCDGRQWLRPAVSTLVSHRPMKSPQSVARVGMVGRHRSGDAFDFRERNAALSLATGRLRPQVWRPRSGCYVRGNILRSEEMPKEDHGDRLQRHPRTCRRMVTALWPGYLSRRRRALHPRERCRLECLASRNCGRAVPMSIDRLNSLVKKPAVRYATCLKSMPTPPSERCPQNWPGIYIGSSRWAAE
jgi:hypothetical protein